MDSFPTPSVTGQQDWEWNRLLENRSAGDQSPRAESTHRRPLQRAGRSRRPPASEPAGSDAQPSEASPEREDERLQSVIVRYERLLDQRNRQLAEATEEPSKPGRGTALVQAARRLIADW